MGARLRGRACQPSHCRGPLGLACMVLGPVEQPPQNSSRQGAYPSDQRGGGAFHHTTSAVPQNGVPHWVCRAAVVGACSCQLSEWAGCMKRKGIHAEDRAQGVGLSKTVLLRFESGSHASHRFLHLTPTMCHGRIATMLAPPAPECDIRRVEEDKLLHSISLPKVSSAS